MKNDQNNPIYPSVPFSCMLAQLMDAVQAKSYKWHLNLHIWSLNLNLGFKPTSFNLISSCISSNTSILPCHDHASYCCVALIVFFHVCRYLSPLGRRCSYVVIVDTNEDSMLSSEVPGKQTPLFISIQSHSLAPALFLLHQDNNDSIVTCCGS